MGVANETVILGTPPQGYVYFKKVNAAAKEPFKAKGGDACYDVVATSKNDLGDGRIEYGVGLAVEIPKGTQLDLRSRSSIYKTGLILANSIGTLDEGYRGEIKAIFYHVVPTLPPYEIGDRILQIQVRSREDVKFIQVDELSDSERGSGGFGSSGR